jgi:precorrin-6Y C5,15-methyltransferase (decarboxylating)
LLLARYGELGGELIRIAISRADAVGTTTSSLRVWRPAMPVTQWLWVKP